MRLVYWTSIPTHHQTHFLRALRTRVDELRVRYFERVDPGRVALGWATHDELADNELFSSDLTEALTKTPDWEVCTHVVPGYSSRFCRDLAQTLSRHRANWVHLSEPARPGARWLLTYPIKAWYASLVNRYALGAFGYGRMATEDFRRWGIRPEITAETYYSVSQCDASAAPDDQCAQFSRGRRALIYSGSLCHRKGTDVLLKAFAQAFRGDDDFVLILVGNDLSKGRYLDTARTLGIADRVLFRGPVQIEALSSVLVTGKTLVLPSRFDGWGVPLNEGASMSMALISTNGTGAAHHLIRRGANGFVVQAGSVSSLARAMEMYRANPAMIERHGKASALMFERFLPEVCAADFQTIVQSWLETRSGLR